MKYYLGLDQGTTGETAVILDESYHQVSRGYHSHRQYYPNPGWVEHDPEEILGSLLLAAEAAMSAIGIGWKEIRAIGFDNQGETCLIWDQKTGRPLGPVIVWQDRRTTEIVDRIPAADREKIRLATGLTPDAYFSAPKLKWLIDHVPGIREKIAEGQAQAGTLDSWILRKLTGAEVHLTDAATASRTMLLNLRTGSWDPELIRMFGLTPEMLPEVRECAGFFGETDPALTGGYAIPITAQLVDQQAALYGQGCFNRGEAKITYGTGCFMLMNLGEKPILSENGLLTSIAWKLRGRIDYALDAGIYVAGAGIEWLRNSLNLISSPAESGEMAERIPDTGDVYFVPAFSGLAAPHWDQRARGAILGMTLATGKEQIVRAMLESIAYQVSDNFRIMTEDTGVSLSGIRADGGMVKNSFLMQFQADVLGVPVEVPAAKEATGIGVARMAAYGIGDLEDPYCRIEAQAPSKLYVPKMTADHRAELLGRWSEAVKRAGGWDIGQRP